MDEHNRENADQRKDRDDWKTNDERRRERLLAYMAQIRCLREAPDLTKTDSPECESVIKLQGK